MAMNTEELQIILKTIQDKSLEIKASISQDLDRRFEGLTDKLTLKIETSIKELVKEEINPLKKQVDDNTTEIKFAKRLGYAFAVAVAFFTDLITKIKALFI